MHSQGRQPVDPMMVYRLARYLTCLHVHVVHRQNTRFMLAGHART
jgi:hypothetical protein